MTESEGIAVVFSAAFLFAVLVTHPGVFFSVFGIVAILYALCRLFG